MAPGDKMFYLVSYKDKKNELKQFKTRKQADEAFNKMEDSTPRVMMSGETGDILMAHGDQNSRDQCLGMFLT